MYKIILYGINGELRQKIEQRLENCEIIGYSDGKWGGGGEFYEYKPFIKPDDLIKIDFDYILITSNSRNSTEQIYKSILNLGIEKNKIIRACFFEELIDLNKADFNINKINSFKGFEMIDTSFEGGIAGMSHSLYGIFTHYLDKKFFKFSMRSADLWEIREGLKKLYYKSDKLKDMKYFIIEMPYFYFNWDCSKSGVIIQNISRFGYYESYHNFKDECIIEELKNLYKLVENEMFENTKFSNNFERRLKGMLNEETIEKNIFEQNMGRWYKKSEETIEENKQIFIDILEILKKINNSIRIVVLVMPLSKYLQIYYEKEVDFAKDIFYSILNDYKNIYDFDIIDLFDIYFDKDLFFVDFTHMNSMGGKDFSIRLNEIFKQKLYNKN